MSPDGPVTGRRRRPGMPIDPPGRRATDGEGFSCGVNGERSDPRQPTRSGGRGAKRPVHPTRSSPVRHPSPSVTPPVDAPPHLGPATLRAPHKNTRHRSLPYTLNPKHDTPHTTPRSLRSTPVQKHQHPNPQCFTHNDQIRRHHPTLNTQHSTPSGARDDAAPPTRFFFFIPSASSSSPPSKKSPPSPSPSPSGSFPSSDPIPESITQSGSCTAGGAGRGAPPSSGTCEAAAAAAM